MCQTDLKVTDDKADLFLKKCYEIYSDYALKNPFYSLEMPIRAGMLREILQVNLYTAHMGRL